MEKVRLKSVPLKSVHIHDGFWDKYIRLVKDVILPYQWDTLNDRVEDAEPSHCIQNFRIAAGEESGTFFLCVCYKTQRSGRIFAYDAGYRNRRRV